MFDRFTDRAKKCMSLARKAALAWSHEYIGTEHLLLGLLDEGTSVACNVLRSMQVDAARLRALVDARVNRGRHPVTMDQLPFTPRAKKVLELAMEEASAIGHSYIGTEHLLLGLLGEARGVAAFALRECGVDLAAARAKVFEFLDECEGHGQPRAVVLERMQGARGSAAANPNASTEYEPVGTVRLVYAAEETPGEGWLPCDGRSIARA
ncbi:MAG: Clp protease N-terminal domain-containing protein, partial [Planctomycetota bacterium]|nr:Clp protease N-terminal domain-containing protein [Planctomycetota bacterium]